VRIGLHNINDNKKSLKLFLKKPEVLPSGILKGLCHAILASFKKAKKCLAIN